MLLVFLCVEGTFNYGMRLHLRSMVVVTQMGLVQTKADVKGLKAGWISMSFEDTYIHTYIDVYIQPAHAHIPHADTVVFETAFNGIPKTPRS